MSVSEYARNPKNSQKIAFFMFNLSKILLILKL